MSNTLPTVRRRASPGTAGFTLIEVMIVVALIGLLAALAGPAMIYGTRRARANNAIFESTSLTTVAQMRATSAGVPQYVIWYSGKLGSGVVLLERADPAPTWASVDLTSRAGLTTSLGGRIIDHTAFEDGVVYLPLDPPPVPSMVGGFPAPFTAIPIAAAGAGDLLEACTFCTAASGGSLGALRFHPNGSATMATAANASGGALALGNLQGTNTGPTTKVLAISVPSGMVRIFQ